MEWQQYFDEVPDFRLERSKLHQLSDILMLSLCAVLCGAEDFKDIATYGRQKEAVVESTCWPSKRTTKGFLKASR